MIPTAMTFALLGAKLRRPYGRQALGWKPDASSSAEAVTEFLQFCMYAKVRSWGL